MQRDVMKGKNKTRYEGKNDSSSRNIGIRKNSHKPQKRPGGDENK
jgi:hypothetical protein